MSSKTVDIIAVFLAELIGTALLMFLGCMSCIPWNGPPSGLQGALSFGLVVMAIITIFGCVSGAHLSPAVTLATVVCETLTIRMAFIYFVAQMLGAFMGYGLLIVVTPAKLFFPEGADTGLCVTLPHDSLTTMQALMIEFIVTSVLILLCCSVWDPRNAKHGDAVPLKFGFAITAIGSVAGPFTGASMNPVRSFAPALWNQNFEHQWIYWIGPLAAGLIMPMVYKTVFRREVETVDITDEDRKVNAIDNIPLKSVV